MSLLEERRPGQNLRPLYALSSLALATSLVAIFLFAGASGFPRSKSLATTTKWAGRNTEIVPYGFEKCDRSGLPTQLAPIRVAGDFIFLSGVLGYNVPCVSAIQDPAGQIKEAFRVLNLTLTAANIRLKDVDSVTSYHTDMKKHLDIFVEEREKYFNEQPFPAWTAIGTNCLYFQGQVLEMSAVARAPPCDSLECSD